jgi:hypothetical protein
LTLAFIAFSLTMSDADRVLETCSRIRCALHSTLCAACPIHNENILANIPEDAMRVARPSKSAKLMVRRTSGLTGVGRMSNRFTQYVLIAMVLGIVMGAAIFNLQPDSRVDIAFEVKCSTA